MNILVVDVGTQSIRGILFNEDGTVILKEQREYGLIHSGDTIVEQNTNLVLDFLFDILKTIGEQAKCRGFAIGAVSVTAQRSSVIPVDKNGKAIRNALMWQDKRAAQICSGLENHCKQIYSICGMKPTPVFSAPKMLWLKQNEPHIYESAYKLIGFCEYVLFHLTEGFYTDTSIASRTCLFDIGKLAWSDTLLDLFEIDKEKLCMLVPVGSICSKTTKKINELLQIAESIPVISAGGDQQCAALGVGCTKNNNIEINTGTGSYAIALSEKPIYDEQMRVMCNVSAIHGCWIIEGALLSAGITVSWLNKEFFADANERQPFENFDKAVLSSPAGANGLLMSSAFAGKGTPFWDPYARGCLLNMSFKNTKNDFARALLEGIAADSVECLDIIDNLLDKKMDKKIQSAGGLAKSVEFNQIQADTYNRTIEKYAASSEATSVGAFISAAVALGRYTSHANAFEVITQEQPKEVFYANSMNRAYYQKTRKIRQQFINTMNNKKLFTLLND